METIAKEAKRLLDPIPEDKWLIGLYGTYSKSNCHCFLGHWNMLHGGQADYSQHEGPIQDAIDEFLRKTGRNNKVSVINGFDINDGDCPFYKQDTPKQRVMALLDDMIAAGY